MKILKTVSLFCLFVLLVGLASAQISSPEEFLGFKVGADKKVADMHQIIDYFQALDKASERIILKEIGKTEMGNPFLVAIITSRANQKKLGRYQKIQQMLADPQVIRDNQWSHNLALLAQARRENCRVGLATMSYCSQVKLVLEILELNDVFDFVASRDDVKHGKPDPEIYLLAARELGVNPGESLVIEDSPSGVQAALNAGMNVVAVSTPFTRQRLHEGGLLPEGHIVDDPADLERIVDHVIRHSCP